MFEISTLDKAGKKMWKIYLTEMQKEIIVSFSYVLSIQLQIF